LELGKRAHASCLGQACSAYRFPEHISPHVHIVIPSIHFDAILKKRGSGVVIYILQNSGNDQQLKKCDEMTK
jgi:hypothetical protein